MCHASSREPVVKLLTTEVDLGITTFQFIDLARLKLPAKTVNTAKKVLKVIDNTITFLEKVDDMSSAGNIVFGDFNLSESSLENRLARDVRQCYHQGLARTHAADRPAIDR